MNDISTSKIIDIFVWNNESNDYQKVSDLIVPKNTPIATSFENISIETITLPEDCNANYRYLLTNCPNIKQIKFEEGWNGTINIYFDIEEVLNTRKVIFDLPSTTDFITGDNFHLNSSYVQRKNIVWLVRSLRPPIILDGLGEIAITNGTLYVPEEAIPYYNIMPGWKLGYAQSLNDWEQNKEEILNRVE